MKRQITNNKQQTAFTLIELLVVIAIIGILATLAIVSLQQARQNARNAKRVADLRQMQTALELYFNENNSYPSSAEFEVGSPLISFSTGKILMQQIPSAPAVADGDCLTSDYNYTANEDNSSYKLKTCISKDINNLEAGIITATPSFMGYLDACDNKTEFTDQRDANTYQIVAIGDQCWMAENLKYLPEVHGPNAEWHSVSEARYSVYGYASADNSVEDAKATTNYQNYGVLYNWLAAMNWDSSVAPAIDMGGSQGVCPDGWHLPTYNEFNDLGRTICLLLGNSDCETNFPKDYIESGWIGINEGDAIKSEATHSWCNSSLNCDASGFSALPAGYRNMTNSAFYTLGSYAQFWSSSALSASNAWWWRLYASSSEVAWFNQSFAMGFSIRCIKD